MIHKTVTSSRRSEQGLRAEIPFSPFAAAVAFGKKRPSRHGLPAANPNTLAEFIAGGVHPHPLYYEFPFPWEMWPKVHRLLQTHFPASIFQTLPSTKTELIVYVAGQRVALETTIPTWMAVSLDGNVSIPIYPITKLEEPYTYVEAAWIGWALGRSECLIVHTSDFLIIGNTFHLVGALSTHIKSILERIAAGGRHLRLPTNLASTTTRLCLEHLSRPYYHT